MSNAVYFQECAFCDVNKECEFIDREDMTLYDITNGETFNFILGMKESLEEDDYHPPVFYEELIERFRKLSR